VKLSNLSSTQTEKPQPRIKFLLSNQIGVCEDFHVFFHYKGEPIEEAEINILATIKTKV
jgi:hypothetical protein